MMNSLHTFPLPGLEIETGTTIIDACKQLGITAVKYPYGNYLVAYGDAQSMFEIRVNQYSLDCYAYDGPLRSVEYGIDPLLIADNKVDFKRSLQILENQFGTADETFGPDTVTMTPRDYDVLAYARWKRDTFDVYMAIYSGVRTHGEKKPCIGQLSFTWKDVVAAAATALAKQNEYVASLKLNQLDTSRAVVFNLKKKSNALTHLIPENERIAQRALSSPLLFETPDPIKALLYKKKSAIAFTPMDTEMIHILVSNMTDSAVLPQRATHLVSCANILPAKGNGGMFLSINGVRVSTDHSSKKIRAILDWLSRKMQIDVTVVEQYDC